MQILNLAERYYNFSISHTELVITTRYAAHRDEGNKDVVEIDYLDRENGDSETKNTKVSVPVSWRTPFPDKVYKRVGIGYV